MTSPSSPTPRLELAARAQRPDRAKRARASRCWWTRWPCCSASAPAPTWCAPARRGRRSRARSTWRASKALAAAARRARSRARRTASWSSSARWPSPGAAARGSTAARSRWACWRTSAGGSWTCTASTRPSRCSSPRRSATSSTPCGDAVTEAAAVAGSVRRVPAPAGGAARPGGAALGGAHAGPTTCATSPRRSSAPSRRPESWSSWRPRSRRLGHAEELGRVAEELAQLLDGDDRAASAALGHASRLVAALERIDPEGAAGWREMLEAACSTPRSWRAAVGVYREGVEVDPARLAVRRAAARRAVPRSIRSTARGSSGSSRAGEEARRELGLLDTADTDLAALSRRLRGGAGRARRDAAARSRRSGRRRPASWRAP